MRSTRKNAIGRIFIALAILFSHASFSQKSSEITLTQLSPAQEEWLGERIFANECAAQRACLTSWNEGEDFPSLGIGHFIWFQRNQDEIFSETFPDLLSHLHKGGIALPDWLQAERLTNNRDSNNDRYDGNIRAGDYPREKAREHPYREANSPWKSRANFYAEINSPRMEELRVLLDTTHAEQAQFIVARLESSIEEIVAQTSPNERERVKNRVEKLSTCHPPAGLYALIDYVHFKGTGLVEGERYGEQGWGLRQVLSAMRDDQPILESFALAAQRILERRVANAPSERQEQRWLKGWHNRINTYVETATLPIALDTCE